MAATSQSAVSCYERGWVSPSIRTLDRLLEICGDPAARARSYAAEAPARRVLKRFPVTLEDWDCRPYFMWS
ncbi:MAG: helix-turn-helix transcriptional regulator, partial [Candidatus Dormiibacterota bacterium]